MNTTMKTDEALRCLRRLMEAEALLDAGRIEAAMAIVAVVRTELDAVGEELTAPISMALMLLDKVKHRIDETALGKDVPIPSEHESTTCSRCGATYDGVHFLALELPHSRVGVWKFDFATLALRQCATPDCNNTLARRTA